MAFARWWAARIQGLSFVCGQFALLHIGYLFPKIYYPYTCVVVCSIWITVHIPENQSQIGRLFCCTDFACLDFISVLRVIDCLQTVFNPNEPPATWNLNQVYTCQDDSLEVSHLLLCGRGGFRLTFMNSPAFPRSCDRLNWPSYNCPVSFTIPIAFISL